MEISTLNDSARPVLCPDVQIRMSSLVWTASRAQARAGQSTGAIGSGIRHRESQGVSQTTWAPTEVSQRKASQS